MLGFLNQFAGITSGLFFFISCALGYRFWLRPILRSRPPFKHYYEVEDSFFAALNTKLAFLKIKLTAATMALLSGILWLHDWVMPVVLGVDWSPWWEKVPKVLWPVISFSVGLFFYWLRYITAKDNEKVIQAVAQGVSPKDAKTYVGVPPQVSLL